MSDDEIARLQQAFEQDGCLKSFIELRRRYPKHEVGVPDLAHTEFLLSMSRFLLEHGIDLALVAGILAGHQEAVEELSLQLLERVHRQQDLRRQGQTHVKRRNTGLSDALINYLTVMMLEAIEREGTRFPPSLLVLVRQQLRGSQPKLDQKYQTRRRRRDALYIALQLQDKGLEPTLNQLADAIGVEPSTVSRWFPNGSLLQTCELCRRNLLYYKTSLEDAKDSWHLLMLDEERVHFI